MKYCSGCKKNKNLYLFGKSSTYSDGLNNICKSCNNIKASAYGKTKQGVITALYSHQKSHSKDNKRPIPSYTKDWFKSWVLSHPLFHTLYDLWVVSDYDRWEKPSVDRKNSLLPYSKDNIEIMTWRENFANARSDSRSGIISSDRPIVGVIQCKLDGTFIKEYISINDAEKQTGISKGNISQVCSGKRKKASGYFWRYKND